MKIGSKVLLILAIFVIVFSSAAFAEFTVVSDPRPGETSLCPRETGTIEDVVWNSNSVSRTFSVRLGGAASAWANVAPVAFTLTAGERKMIYTYMTPKSEVSAGKYSLNVIVEENGQSKTIEHQINVKKCFGVDITSLTNTKDICPEGNVKYDLTLTNTGEYLEGFTLTLEGNIPSAKLSQERVRLEPGESIDVVVFAAAPKVSGEYNFNLIATGDSGKSKDVYQGILRVLPCYDFDMLISGNTNYQICDHTLVELPVSVKNKGTVRQKYDVKLSGEQWGISSTSKIDLLPEDEETFKLTFAPTYGIAGVYDFKLELIPELGDKKAESNLHFVVRDCNEVSMLFNREVVTACKSGTPQSVEVRLKNGGEFEKNYKLAIKDLNWVTVDGENEFKFSLAPGKEITKTIIIKPNADVAASKYDVLVGVAALDESDESAYAAFSTNVIDAKECFKASLEPLFDEVYVYRDSNVILPINIKQEGYDVSNYELFVGGSAADFTLLNPKTTTLNAGESSESYLYLAPKRDTSDGEYQALLSLRTAGGEVVDTATVTIKVTNDSSIATPLETADELPITESNSEQKLGAWFSGLFGKWQRNETSEDSASTSWIGENRYYILGVIIIVLLIFIVLRVGIFEKKEEIKEEKPIIKKRVEKKEIETPKKVEEKKVIRKKEVELKEKVSDEAAEIKKAVGSGK